MKFLPLASGVAFLLLGGCATLSDADRAALQQRRVFPPLQERMAERESLDQTDIIELSQKGLPPDFIVRYLRSTGQVFHLTSRDVGKLQQAGVRTGVIDYMLSTPSLYAPRYEEPWYRYEPYYYYQRPLVIVRDRRSRR